MSKIPSRNEWIFGSIRNPLEDKSYMIKSVILQMLGKSTRIFKYGNLPETIQQKDLETQLQVGGYNIWKVVKDNLYTFIGGLGGEPNPYYLPTIAIVANPALRYNAELTIDENCVVMLNDSYYQGMMPMFSKYAHLLTEAEISLLWTVINARIPALIEADNDSAYQSAVEFLNKITDGTKYGVVAGKPMLDGIRTHDFFKEHYIKDVIEAIQYIKGSWYNEIGLNAAFNMKREAINEAEATLNEDILYPTVDNMLECRQYALEKVNKMFGTNITVELDSVWKNNRQHEELVVEREKAEIEEIKNGDIDSEVNDDENERNSDEESEN